ncbi:MAG: hypothetical protein Q8S33_18100 [Myxococcales bacterium]|nr:hypothetical protein [Myxococcales bacterium]
MEQVPKPVAMLFWHWPAPQLGMPPSTLQNARQIPDWPPAAAATHCRPRAQKAEVVHAPPDITVPPD